MAYKIVDKWPNRLCFVGYCFRNLFKATFSFSISSKFEWCNHKIVLTRLQLRRI